MKEMTVRLTFTNELLGTLPGNKELFRDYVAGKAETADEEAGNIPDVDASMEKGTTVFPRNKDGKVFLYDYQLRGFFKEACKFLKKVEGTRSSKLKAYKQQIDGLIFIRDRENVIGLAGDIGICERPLRASTPMGERVALSRSESVPEGSTVEFTVVCMVDSDTDTVREWLDYGAYHGTGQWRNGSKGTFVWEEII